MPRQSLSSASIRSLISLGLALRVSVDLDEKLRVGMLRGGGKGREGQECCGPDRKRRTESGDWSRGDRWTRRRPAKRNSGAIRSRPRVE
jgi:hypothetical protein